MGGGGEKIGCQDRLGEPAKESAPLPEGRLLLVPETGIEPVRQFDPPTDFKSVVSTYFTTQAAHGNYSGA